MSSSITVKWDNEQKTIAMYEYQGHWTWADLFSAIDECNQMIDEVDHSVGIIIDMRGSAGMPNNAFSQAKQIDKKRHRHIQYEVTVGAGMFTEILASTYQKIYGAFGGEIKTSFASSIEDARKMIFERLNEVENCST